jgi:Pectate lyase superfamily protein
VPSKSVFKKKAPLSIFAIFTFYIQSFLQKIMFKKTYLNRLLLFITTLLQAQDTNILDFGAKSDGVTLNTEAIQKAINQTAVKGGRVVIPQGEFLSGTIYLKSNVTLYIQKGGMLKGSPNLKDYPENTPSVKGMKPHRAFWKSMPSRALVYADNVENIGLMGEGIIDGNGRSPAFLTKDDDPNRPKLIFVVNCRKVRVENLRFQNTAFWLQHYFACDGVIIKGLNIYNHGNKNVDGIDIADVSANCSALLPVELINFNAAPLNKTVKLDWITASEKESHHYDIEQSIEGKIFKKIGTV